MAMGVTEEAAGCCSAKQPLMERILITDEQAHELVTVFKVLASNSRLRLLHALVRAGEIRVSDLAEALAMKPQAVSNQLQRLADRRIIRSRREGNNIFYRIVDPCVITLLEKGLCLIEDAKELMA